MPASAAHTLRLYSPLQPPETRARENAPVETISELVSAYLADSKAELGGDTYRDQERTLKRFVESFGSRSDLRPSEFRTWIHSQADWASANTRWCRANIVQRLFNWAVSDRRLPSNPIKGARIAKGDRRRPTTQLEYRAMLKWSDPCFRRCLVFWRWNGQRPQDMTSLLWEWIEWADGKPRKATIPADRHKTGRKTGKKTILFHPVVAQLLSWLAREQLNSERPLKGNVFLNSRGKPWTRVSLSQRLLGIRAKSGISKEATFHGLRHLLGTEWVARGGSLDLLAAFLGHKTSRTTETYYVHREAMEQQIIDAASRLIGPTP